MASFTASAVAVCRSRSTISRRSGYSRTSPPPSDSNDPSLGSWLEIPAESDFPLQNLPFGVIGRDGEEHIAVAIGENALDLYVAGAFGLLDEIADREIFLAPTLNALLHQRSEVWTATRRRVSQLLRAGNRELHEARIAESALPRRDRVHSLLPVEIGDFVDFYASLEHATNLGRILRPNQEPLLANWRWLPIGYHGRSGTVVVSGTEVSRPKGQVKPPDAAAPEFRATAMLDFEAELGIVTGASTEALTSQSARRAIFGLVLLNDWSARDIQAWEYQPLGPFLGKSFATTISPWIVTLDALEPFRTDGPVQEPKPLPHLAQPEPRGFEIALEVLLESRAMRDAGSAPLTIARPNFRSMYWSPAQMLAHLTSNGSHLRAGDLLGTGTISGSEPHSYGSMIELSWRGRDPIALPDGSQRSFLEDGDRVTLIARCSRENATPIGFGEAAGTIR